MSWSMYASIAPVGDVGPPLRHFGPLLFATQDRRADGFVEVELDEDRSGPYWSWLDPGAAEPVHICGSRERLEHLYRGGDSSQPGLDEEQAAGQGRVVRLRVTIVAEAPVSRRQRMAIPDWPVP